MPNMCNIIHNDYDRISDKVMWLGFGATLNFNVDLFFKRKDNVSKENIKENFHREFLYKLNQDDGTYRVKILRDFNYYFTIEYNLNNIKERATIGPDQIYFFIFNLKKVMQWFIGENGINTIFSKKDGKLFIPTHPEPIKINLAFDGYIEFEPAIDSSSGYEVIGVKCYLNNDGIFFFMNSDTLFSLYHMVSTCNMYSLAQNILNYIGRPEYGTNSYNMVTGVSSNNNRPQQQPTQNLSFFDRVGAKSQKIDP